jgi:hypothetical protein
MRAIKIFTASLFLLITMSFNLPDVSDKQLRKELSRLLAKKEYSLNELAVPAKYKLMGHFYEIESAHLKPSGLRYVYAGRVNTVRSAASTGKTGESADYFDYFILYDSDRKVLQVKITNYQSSHGEMISSPGWLKKFAGYSANKPLEVGRQVDAISGATISVNNITFDIKQKTHILAEITR